MTGLTTWYVVTTLVPEFQVYLWPNPNLDAEFRSLEVQGVV
jgi:hypothetical protein